MDRLALSTVFFSLTVVSLLTALFAGFQILWAVVLVCGAIWLALSLSWRRQHSRSAT